MQFSPSDILKPFIKSYSVITLDRDLNNEVFYPSGYVDLAFNVSDGRAATIIDGHHRNMPHTEVLGQLTLPTRLTVAKGTSVILARIYPHASKLFLNTPISEFTNYAVDLDGIFTNESRELHDHLMYCPSDEKKIKTLDSFLTNKLIRNEKVYRKTQLIAQVCGSICVQGESFDMKQISGKHGLSERYAQRLFLDLVGLTPQSFFNIRRFNRSVNLVLSSNASLTSIAYECGYHDQAHFIKEFRKYTGVTPSQARPSLSQGTEFQQAVNIGL